MPKYQDDETMEDDDSYLNLNNQDDGLPMLCRCGQLFEAHEGQVSFETGKLICGTCREKEKAKAKSEIRKEILLIEARNRSLKAQLICNLLQIEKLTLQL